jgi:hypothetical protein
MKILLASLKTLVNSKHCSVSRIKFLFRLSFALIGRFFLVYEYIHTWLSDQFSGSLGGYGTTVRDTGDYHKAGKSSLKRFTAEVGIDTCK